MDRKNLWLIIGAINGAFAVLAGAYGAHIIDVGHPDSALLLTFQKAVRYQMYHALGLVSVGLTLSRGAGATAVWAGWLFIVGSIIFSGSLYALAITGARWWGAITPIGGVSFMLGWAVFAWSIWMPEATQ